MHYSAWVRTVPSFGRFKQMEDQARKQSGYIWHPLRVDSVTADHRGYKYPKEERERKREVGVRKTRGLDGRILLNLGVLPARPTAGSAFTLESSIEESTLFTKANLHGRKLFVFHNENYSAIWMTNCHKAKV